MAIPNIMTRTSFTISYFVEGPVRACIENYVSNTQGTHLGIQNHVEYRYLMKETRSLMPMLIIMSICPTSQIVILDVTMSIHTPAFTLTLDLRRPEI